MSTQSSAPPQSSHTMWGFNLHFECQRGFIRQYLTSPKLSLCRYFLPSVAALTIDKNAEDFPYQRLIREALERALAEDTKP